MAKKKSTTRKKSATTVRKKRKTLKRIPKDKYFVFADGTKVGHYLSLADVLETIEDAVLAHHMNEVKNDFSVWIKEVFGEEDLAQVVDQSKTLDELRLEIYKHVIKEHIRR